MSLQDLIIDSVKISAELVESILKGRVELVKEGMGVHLTKETNSLPTRLKILLYLCGKHAWEIITQSEEKNFSSIEEISNEVGVFGSTMRGALSSLKNEHLTSSQNGKYAILPKGVRSLEELIKIEAEHPSGSNVKNKSKSNGKKGSAIRPETKQIHLDKSFSQEYVTKMRPILRDATNKDKYILIIHMAKEGLGIDGLTPAEVNYLLTEPPVALPSKFYVTNISRDLGALRDFVTPYKTGQAYKYTLNSVGQELVESLIQKVTKENLTKKPNEEVN